jgi:hypothetical protein
VDKCFFLYYYYFIFVEIRACSTLKSGEETAVLNFIMFRFSLKTLRYLSSSQIISFFRLTWEIYFMNRVAREKGKGFGFWAVIFFPYVLSNF